VSFVFYCRFDEHSPFAEIQLESAHVAAKLVSRGVLVKAAFEVWGEGTDFDSALQAISRPRATEANSDSLPINRSWSMQIEGVGSRYCIISHNSDIVVFWITK
jgi:hypothetical protein